MKPLTHPSLVPFRAVKTELQVTGSAGHPLAGMFEVPSTLDKKLLRAVVSTAAAMGTGWDHVSVSRRDRVPNWYEMRQIKELFFEPDEWVMQVHPPRSEWVNNAPHCLHLWRPSPTVGTIPRPPANLVGVQGMGPEEAAAYARGLARTGR